MADTSNIVKLLSALLGPAQDIENALQQLFTERHVDTALGAQLDVLGKIVGQDRGGLDDDTYRRYIRARISVHRSNGTIRDIIKVADLILYNDNAYLHVINSGVAALMLVVEDIVVTALVRVLVSFLRSTVSAGVRLVLQTWPAAEASLFAFSGDIGLGWGSVSSGSVGGVLASGQN